MVASLPFLNKKYAKSLFLHGIFQSKARAEVDILHDGGDASTGIKWERRRNCTIVIV